MCCYPELLDTDFHWQLENEAPLHIPALVAMDGGQSVKRSAAAGHADARSFYSDYIIPPEQVDVYANEVKRRVQPAKKVRHRDLFQLAPALLIAYV